LAAHKIQIHTTGEKLIRRPVVGDLELPSVRRAAR
jgi:hypothetical protein